MGRRGKKQYLTHEHELFALQWEFLRRNPKYIRDVKKWLADARKVRDRRSQEWFDLKLARQMYFMATYGVADILDPKISFVRSRVPLRVVRPRPSRRRRGCGAVGVKGARSERTTSEFRVA